VYYVVQMTTRYSSIDEVRAAAPEELAAHMRRSAEFRERGELLMAGAFLDNGPGELVRTMGVLTTREAAEEYAKGDPFVLAGRVSDCRVREWANMFAGSAGSSGAA
jgi:uncharacterized protein YciI